jgi:hypothetical protein
VQEYPTRLEDWLCAYGDTGAQSALAARNSKLGVRDNNASSVLSLVWDAGAAWVAAREACQKAVLGTING